MDRIIFLSIDGVLNNNKTEMYDAYREIDDEMATTLAQLIRKTDAKIVLTDYRAYDMFHQDDFEYIKEYIEKNIAPIYKVLCPVNGLENRGENIAQFLYWDYELNGKDVDFIILDNNYRDYNKYDYIYNHLFICDDFVGLNSASIDLCEYENHYTDVTHDLKYTNYNGYLSDFTFYVMSALYPELFQEDEEFVTSY